VGGGFAPPRTSRRNFMKQGRTSIEINIIVTSLTKRLLDGPAAKEPDIQLEGAPAAARLADDTERAAEAKAVVRRPAVVKK